MCCGLLNPKLSLSSAWFRTLALQARGHWFKSNSDNHLNKIKNVKSKQTRTNRSINRMVKTVEKQKKVSQ